MAMPYTELKLDKVYRLRWDIPAMINFEKDAGKNCFQVDCSVETTIQKLHAMLKTDNPDITLEQTMELAYNYRGKGGITVVLCKVIDTVTDGQYTESPNAEAPVAESTNS